MNAYKYPIFTLIIITLVIITLQVHSQSPSGVLKRANRLYNQDRYTEALEWYKYLSSWDPSEHIYLGMIAGCYQGLQNPRMEFVYLHKALAKKTDDPEYLAALGLLHYTCNSDDSAGYYLQKAVDAGDFEGEGNMGLAMLFFDHGFYDKADTLANKAIRLAPKNSWHYLSRALINAARHDTAAALADLVINQKMAPKDVWQLSDRGSTYYELGKYDLAKTVLQQALALNPQNPEAAYYQSLLMRREGNITEADRLYEIYSRDSVDSERKYNPENVYKP